MKRKLKLDFKSTEEISKLLKKRRKNLKISQKELSEILGVSQSRISKIENGKFLDDFIFWGKLLKTLKVTQEHIQN